MNARNIFLVVLLVAAIIGCANDRTAYIVVTVEPGAIETIGIKSVQVIVQREGLDPHEQGSTGTNWDLFKDDAYTRAEARRRAGDALDGNVSNEDVTFPVKTRQLKIVGPAKESLTVRVFASTASGEFQATKNVQAPWDAVSEVTLVLERIPPRPVCTPGEVTRCGSCWIESGGHRQTFPEATTLCASDGTWGPCRNCPVRTY